ncbi:protein phosphatase 1 regulatory subunit 3B [Pseudoliparis swirei]|uniref:protein phosphatase 1 regulatory subunit 3B n=1 Tax=Pseudoliparis swirei TaxID=2059687 RepID=UPI0024BD7CBE|nr:protein phosphatase 1 regulatory subunit 3B [Pseudoliparis swirei]
MAVPLSLSQEEFVYRLSPQTGKAALSSCLRLQRSRCVDEPAPEDGPAPRKDSGNAKKQVTFADHRGLSLTKVKTFSRFGDLIDVPLNIRELLRSALSLVSEEDRLVLDFAPPSSDYLHFRKSLERNSVCLEHCVLKERALAGTVKVKNVSFQKAVKLRLTSDGWRSHRDVSCQYVKDSYPTAHSDTFSFSAALPDTLRPHERVEFAVCYEVCGREYWDSNQGGNYRTAWASSRGAPQATCGGAPQTACSRLTDSFDCGIHFDSYGSPTCSHGPDWPSYAGCENTGPYY